MSIHFAPTGLRLVSSPKFAAGASNSGTASVPASGQGSGEKPPATAPAKTGGKSIGSYLLAPFKAIVKFCSTVENVFSLLPAEKSGVGTSLSTDGVVYTDIGGTTIGSNGKVITHIGNMGISSDGTTYTRIGNTSIGSDGSIINHF